MNINEIIADLEELSVRVSMLEKKVLQATSAQSADNSADATKDDTQTIDA